MSSLTLILIMLLLAITSIQSQKSNPCLINREDVVPCLDHSNSGTVSPGPNQYTIHATRFQRGADGLPICIKRKEGEILRSIQDLGSAAVKFIFSPGAEQEPRMNYTNQILVEYNVTCEAETPAFIRFETLDLEPKNCDDGTQLRCQDYVEIDAGDSGSMEYCGNEVPILPFIVGTGIFTLKFRSSFSDSYPGFRVFVTCVSSAESEQDVKLACKEPKKSAVVELIDLTDEKLRNKRGISKKTQPMTLTTAEMRTVDRLAESLFTVALSRARRTTTKWPPASYLQNRPGDILDLNDLAPQLPPAARSKKKTFTREVKEPVQLDSEATMEAVENENACNPIVRSVARSYITVAKKIDPIQLKQAQEELEQQPSLA